MENGEYDFDGTQDKKVSHLWAWIDKQIFPTCFDSLDYHECYICSFACHWKFHIIIIRVPMLVGNLGNSWEFDLGHSQPGIILEVVGNPQKMSWLGKWTAK